jgi:hypothetical protein
VAYQPSATDVATIRSLDAAVYRMVMGVVSKGGSIAAPYPTTLSFQMLWNASKAAIDRVATGTGLAAKGVQWFRLTEDGLYGPNTGKALSFVTGVPTPAKTADVPKWYLSNKTLIDSYAQTLPQAVMSQPAATVATAQAPITTSPSSTVGAYNASVIAAASSGTTTQANVPNQSAYGSAPSTVISQKVPADVAMDAWDVTVGTAQIAAYPSKSAAGTVTVKQVQAPPQLAAQAKASSDIAKMTSDVAFGPESVPVSRPRTNLVVFAVGAGLLAAAGVFGYMASQRGGHHRRVAA